VLKVVLFSSKQMIYEGQARSVTLPGEQGWFEVHPFHKPLLTRLKAGSLLIDKTPFAIRHGAVKVKNNEVVIMARPVGAL